jgi:hypothetical protein
MNHKSEAKMERHAEKAAQKAIKTLKLTLTRMRLTGRLFEKMDVPTRGQPYTLRWVRLRDLYSIQTWVRLDGVRRYQDAATFPAICVIDVNGRLIVRDGYHRIASCLNDGCKRVLARIYKGGPLTS